MKFSKVLASVLVVSMFVTLPFSSSAAIIGTDQSQESSNRAKLQEFMSRSDVVSKLETMGIAPEKAIQRVAALTSDEVNFIAKEMDTLPTGGYITETGGVIIGVTLIIIVALTTRNN